LIRSSSVGLSRQPRYSAVAILLHWLLAIVILAMFAMGLYMADLPFSPMRMKLYNWHKWAGVCFLSLTVLRLVWRATHRPPALPQAVTLSMPGWQMQAFHATHYLMYALFFVVPLLGWAYSSAIGYQIVLFGVLPLPDLVGADKALAELIKPLHGLSAWALIVLAVLHIGAALKHQWLDRDGLMQRMLPGRS
jgi:cytochrome b561